jgi:hypothetical protein
MEMNVSEMDVSIEKVEKVGGLRKLESGSHLDHLFRQTRIHHTQLSQMADVKASMMLTLASLIITFSIGYLDDPYLRWPVFVMIGFCVITILAAAYAVMPKLSLDSQPDLINTNRNILFFGNFFNLEYDEYAELINEVVQDPTHTYEAQLREIYEMGVYLGRKKYRYIRIAYTSFLIGVTLSVLVLLLVEVANLVLNL